MNTDVDTYILVGRLSDLVMVKHYEGLKDKDVRIQASINMSRIHVRSLLPASFDLPVVNKEEGYMNIDRFCNYSIVIGLLAHTPSLLILVDGFPTIIGHRILDSIYTTVNNVVPRRIKESKEMGIHSNSTSMQEWYYLIKNCERLQYKQTDFNYESDLNNIDNIINGITNSTIENVLKTYFPSKFSPSILGNIKAMPTKILAFNDSVNVDKEFPYTIETRSFGYKSVDTQVEQMKTNIKPDGDDGAQQERKPKIEISSH